jgi:hypothetical protein
MDAKTKELLDKTPDECFLCQQPRIELGVFLPSDQKQAVFYSICQSCIDKHGYTEIQKEVERRYYKSKIIN